MKKTNLKNLIDELEKNKSYIHYNLKNEYENLIETFDKDKINLLNQINDIFLKEKNLMTLTKTKIEKQSLKLRSYIAEMECLSHDINKLTNQEILEINLNKLTELNNETTKIILESIKNKNSNIQFKDIIITEDCLLKKSEIILGEYFESNKISSEENKRKNLSNKINLTKKLSKDFTEMNNLIETKFSKLDNLIKKDSENEYFNIYNYNKEYSNTSIISDNNITCNNQEITIENNKKNNILLQENPNIINKEENFNDYDGINSEISKKIFEISLIENVNTKNVNNLILTPNKITKSYSVEIDKNFRLSEVFKNQNSDMINFDSFRNDNNFFREGGNLINNEIINTSNINIISNNERKKTDNDVNSNLNGFNQKSFEKTYINNLNNNFNLKYKIIKNEESENANLQNYVDKTGFYDFQNLTDLILFFGDSKDKSLLLFNKNNYNWKKLENSILGEYEFLDYSCIIKFTENSYLISGGCIYSNYKNTAVNTTYLAKIMNHKDIFLISFTPFKPMNKPRFSHGNCNLRNKVYVYGGHNGSSTLNCIEYCDGENNNWKYVTETEDKSILSEMNVEREIFASCAVDDQYIFVFGGFNDIHLDSIERFDVETGKWRLLNIKLSSPLQNSTACYLGNSEIAIIGGYNGSLQRGLEILNIKNLNWVNNPELKLVIPRRRAHCYKNNDKVIIFFY